MCNERALIALIILYLGRAIKLADDGAAMGRRGPGGARGTARVAALTAAIGSDGHVLLSVGAARCAHSRIHECQINTSRHQKYSEHERGRGRRPLSTTAARSFECAAAPARSYLGLTSRGRLVGFAAFTAEARRLIGPCLIHSWNGFDGGTS